MVGNLAVREVEVSTSHGLFGGISEGKLSEATVEELVGCNCRVCIDLWRSVSSYVHTRGPVVGDINLGGWAA